MLKTILKVVLVSTLVFAISGCAAVGVPTVDPNAIGTAIAQTMAAFSPTSTTSPVITVTSSETPAPPSATTTAPTLETSSPTTTSTLIASVTSTAITLLTATPPATLTPIPPGTVQVSVSVPTNCRVGPGVIYPRVGALRLNEVAEVMGRHASRDYWIIRLPGTTNQTCWLWGQYATVSGNADALPVFTPPPAPATFTPVVSASSFDIAYEGLESCSGTGWWVELGLENLGGVTFRSISFTIEDRDADVSLTQNANRFINRNGCNETETRDTLGPDVSRKVSSPLLTANPTGHRLRATIRLCSDTGQSGTCVSQTVNIIP
jgi:hypothetical protein